jgi:hypothetical protein
MKSRVFQELKHFLSSLHFSDTWPNFEEVQSIVVKSAQYRAVADLGLPDVCEFRNLEHLKTRVTNMIVSRICDEWIERQLHLCLPLIELKRRFKRDSGGNAVLRGVDFELRPVHEDEICTIYYQNLESKIFNTLLREEQTYKYEELDILIPSIEAPGYYDRDRIILSYFESIEGIEPQGKDWTDTIEMLKFFRKD